MPFRKENSYSYLGNERVNNMIKVFDWLFKSAGEVKACNLSLFLFYLVLFYCKKIPLFPPCKKSHLRSRVYTQRKELK